jgi:hypothetical protein
MPMHDWKKVPDGIFHAFHHGWIWAISDHLNAGCLPTDYYALPEQVAAGRSPDVLTLQSRVPAKSPDGDSTSALATASPSIARPRTRFTAESEGESYRRRKKSVVVRHARDDRVVAIVEIVSPGNKSTTHNLHTFVEKALEFFDRGVHLLIIDPLPLFLEAHYGVDVPLEKSYQAAYNVMPRRWRDVLDN